VGYRQTVETFCACWPRRLSACKQRVSYFSISFPQLVEWSLLLRRGGEVSFHSLCQVQRKTRRSSLTTAVMAGNTRRKTPASSPDNQQLYSKDTTQTRRLRLRHSARHESSKTPQDSCLQYGPKLTKTGRISKAKKGVRDAHTCRQCGKVRASSSCPVFVC